MFHERHGAFDRSQVGGWLTVYGALVVTLLGGSLGIASEHQRAPAEPRPDFSGRWVLESTSTPASEVARTLSVQQSAPQTGPRGGSMISALERIAIEREGSVAESHQIGIVGGVVGGTVAGKDADGRPRGPVSSYAVKWDGNTLVFESESHDQTAANPWTERREAWSLDEAGRLRIVLTTRSSDRSARTLTLLYRRQ
jgi:hypothetical protein